jgi:hypothetical protein
MAFLKSKFSKMYSYKSHSGAKDFIDNIMGGGGDAKKLEKKELYFSAEAKDEL